MLELEIHDNQSLQITAGVAAQNYATDKNKTQQY